MNIIYAIRFVFFATEKVENYWYILQCKKQLYEILNVSNPSMIIINIDITII